MVTIFPMMPKNSISIQINMRTIAIVVSWRKREHFFQLLYCNSHSRLQKAAYLLEISSFIVVLKFMSVIFCNPFKNIWFFKNICRKRINKYKCIINTLNLNFKTSYPRLSKWYSLSITCFSLKWYTEFHV